MTNNQRQGGPTGLPYDLNQYYDFDVSSKTETKNPTYAPQGEVITRGWGGQQQAPQSAPQSAPQAPQQGVEQVSRGWSTPQQQPQQQAPMAPQQPEEDLNFLQQAWEGVKAGANTIAGDFKSLDARLTPDFIYDAANAVMPGTPYSKSKQIAEAKLNYKLAEEQKKRGGTVGAATAFATELAGDVAPMFIPGVGWATTAARLGGSAALQAADAYGSRVQQGKDLEGGDMGALIRGSTAFIPGSTGFRKMAGMSLAGDAATQLAESYEQDKDFNYNAARGLTSAVAGGTLGKVLGKLTDRTPDTSLTGNTNLSNSDVSEQIGELRGLNEKLKSTYGTEQILTPESVAVSSSKSTPKQRQDAAKGAFDEGHGYEVEMEQQGRTDEIFDKMGNERISTDGTQSFDDRTLSGVDADIKKQADKLVKDMSELKKEHYNIEKFKTTDPGMYQAYKDSNLRLEPRRKLAKKMNKFFADNPHLDLPQARQVVGRLLSYREKGGMKVFEKVPVEKLDGMVKNLNKVWKANGKTDNVALEKMKGFISEVSDDPSVWTSKAGEDAVARALEHKRSTTAVYKEDIAKANDFVRKLRQANSKKSRESVLKEALESDDFGDIVQFTGWEIFDDVVAGMVKNSIRRGKVKGQSNRQIGIAIKDKLGPISDRLKELSKSDSAKFGKRGQQALDAARKSVDNKLTGARATEPTLEGLSDSSRTEKNKGPKSRQALRVLGDAALGIFEPITFAVTARRLVRDMKNIMTKDIGVGPEAVDKIVKRFDEMEARLNNTKKPLTDDEMNKMKRAISMSLIDLAGDEPELVVDQEEKANELLSNPVRMDNSTLPTAQPDVVEDEVEETDTVLEEEAPTKPFEMDAGGLTLDETLRKLRIYRKHELTGADVITLTNVSDGEGGFMDVSVKSKDISSSPKKALSQKSRINTLKNTPVKGPDLIAEQVLDVVEPEKETPRNLTPEVASKVDYVKTSASLAKLENLMKEDTTDFARITIKPLIASAKDFEKRIEKYDTPETLDVFTFLLDEYKDMVEDINLKVMNETNNYIEDIKLSSGLEADVPELLKPKSPVQPRLPSLY